MGQGTLTIYSASAGSGKTFNLARNYLSRIFRSKNSYRKILAVTFTNKATAEMKDRILDQLYNLANGSNSDYLAGIMKDTGKTEQEIRDEAGGILFSILHDFSRFSVSTIDTFFQRILRAFVREAGLHSGFNIELDHSVILSSAVDEMISSATVNVKIRNWLSSFVMTNLEEEKSWNLKDEIMILAEELFREKFKILSGVDRSNLENKEFLLSYIKKIRSVSSSFEKKLTGIGRECLGIFNEYDLSDDMFYQKSKGIPSFIRSLSQGKIPTSFEKVREILKDPPRWATKDPSPQLLKAIYGGLDRLLKEAITFYDSNILSYNSASFVLANIYTLGILSDISEQIHRITTELNTFLLSDAGELLSLITGGDQTPFIYEKIGSSYENYMIDEFQDTSLLQWANFQPLISESMDNGYDNLLVGDIKQSIYRFRNSDWRILAGMHESLIDNKRYLSKPLKINFRSRTNIIRFNNTLFSVIPEQIGMEFSEGSFTPDFAKLYSEAVQDDPGMRSGGYVRLEFVDDEREKENDIKKTRKKILRKWEDIVLEKLPSVLEAIQDKGYNASDIGIIVREGKEGEAVLRRIVEYSNSCSPEMKQKYNYNIVSSDSLSLSGSNAISFIIAALKVLESPDDLISRAAMVRYFLLATSGDNPEKAALFADRVKEGSPGVLPEGSNKFLDRVRAMPLFEAIESMIRFFGLGNHPWNVAYLSTFQDLVLTFAGGTNSGIQSFLEWWETTGYKKSVALPANQDAARVLTIHKSKGLEFKAVILPFISWNLDHKNLHQPILWLKPDQPPFDELKILPVRYCQDLERTFFAQDYLQEKLSAYIDNINLLYVAMTRAMDAVYGFAPLSPSKDDAIAGVVLNAITSESNPAGDSGIILNDMYDSDTGVFEFGEVPEANRKENINADIISHEYRVSSKPGSLRLRLHAESYFAVKSQEISSRIDYGKLMHEVFEAVNTKDDISEVVSKMVLEGKISESESASLSEKLVSLISGPKVEEWFKPSGKILKEAQILLPSGDVRRPDRVIISGIKAVVVDFKFGEERRDHLDQIRSYLDLLNGMGYSETEGYLWYVDRNVIVTA